MMNSYVLICLGAIFGALSRYYLSLFCLKKWGNRYGYGTFIANLTGSFLIGIISTIIMKNTIPLEIKQLILIGFLGAYTTFSSYILDSYNLFKEQRFSDGFLYWLGTPLLGFISIKLGIISGNFYQQSSIFHFLE